MASLFDEQERLHKIRAKLSFTVFPTGNLGTSPFVLGKMGCFGPLKQKNVDLCNNKIDTP
jgi:hypothetical protein